MLNILLKIKKKKYKYLTLLIAQIYYFWMWHFTARFSLRWREFFVIIQGHQ